MANVGPAEDFTISSSQKNRTRDLWRSTYLTETFKGGNVTVEVVDSREQYLDGYALCPQLLQIEWSRYNQPLSRA